MKRLRFLFLAVFLNMLLVACSIESSEMLEVTTKQSIWSYDESTGPDYWGELAPMYSACVNGMEQSPINLDSTQVTEEKKFKGLQINYEPTKFTLTNNGHTIQAEATTKNSSIIIEGKQYKLAQFHFHTPSEHQFNGVNYNMELHLVHKSEHEELAVIGLMIKEGSKNNLFATMWESLPIRITDEATTKKYTIDLPALMPEILTSFHYDGSLTTPPCTEEVKWVVMEEPINMSKEQIEAFQQIFSNNHRPVQPLNERKVIKR